LPLFCRCSARLQLGAVSVAFDFIAQAGCSNIQTRPFQEEHEMPAKSRIALLAAVTAMLCFAAVSRSSIASPADPSEEAQIRAVLDMQTAAWNRGDIDTFMTSYWKSEQTEFLGASGIAHGWQSVLDRYHHSYPDRKSMGTVSFSDLEVHLTCADAAYVVGKFHLVREADQPSGVFSLDFRKFPEGWRIVLDHTTAFPAAAVVPASSH
jgi:ketosteroid isomerase-like protein